MANIVEASNAAFIARTYAMPDNTFVDLFKVELPTTNTSCSVIIMAEYTISDGVHTGNHVGMYCWSFVNDAGVVSGQGVDFAEATSGTGAGAGIDAETVSVVSTTATAQMKFNTTLVAVGSFTYRILFSTSTTLTRL